MAATALMNAERDTHSQPELRYRLPPGDRYGIPPNMAGVNVHQRKPGRLGILRRWSASARVWHAVF